MFIFSYTAAVLAIVCVVIAAVIFFEKWKDPLARYLAFYSLTIGLWVGANSAADVAIDSASLVTWSGIALIAASASVSFYMTFVETFLSGTKANRSRLIAYFLPTILFSAGAFTEYSVKQTIFLGDAPTQIVPGVIYLYFPIFLLGGLIFGSIQLLNALKRSPTAEKRLQILYMEAGFVPVIVGGIMFTLLLPLFGELRFFNVGPQFAIFFIAFSSYAIFKHRLLDFKVVIQKSVVYSLLFLVVVGFYLAVLYSTLLYQDSLSGPSYLFASILTTFAGIFGIPSIKVFFERATDRYFYRDRYVWREAMDELSRLLNEKADLDELVEAIEKSLKGILKTKYAKVTVFEKTGEPHGDPSAHIDFGDTVARRIEAKIPGELKTILFRCEGYEAQLDRVSDASLIDASETIIPSILQDRLVALIGIGPKLSTEPFFEDDIDLLKSFSFQAAVAFEKARLYHAAKDYSASLEGRVKESAEEIRGLQAERSALLHEIAHELQEPLATIRARLEIVRERCGDENTIRSLEQAVDRIEAYVKDKETSAENGEPETRPTSAAPSIGPGDSEKPAPKRRPNGATRKIAARKNGRTK